MGSEPPSATAAVGTLFTAFERVVLFALSLAIAVLNLLIGVAVAAHLGIIPKTAAVRVNQATGRAAAFIEKVMGPERPAAPKRKTKP